MRSIADARFVEERIRFRLRQACEDCVHFVASEESCAHGYPTEDHRAARFEALAVGSEVVFCKEWELR